MVRCNAVTHPDDSAVEQEPLALGEEHGAVLLVRLWCLESGLVLVGVELVVLLGWVKPLETVLLECVHENVLRHLEAIKQSGQLLVATVQRLLGNSPECAVQVVDAVEEISCESLQCKVLGRLHLTLGLLLQVTVFGNGALPLVL